VTGVLGEPTAVCSFPTFARLDPRLAGVLSGESRSVTLAGRAGVRTPTRP